MKCVASIEKHGAFFLLAFLFSFFYTACTTFSRVGAGYLLYAADLPGPAVCALDAHQR